MAFCRDGVHLDLSAGVICYPQLCRMLLRVTILFLQLLSAAAFLSAPRCRHQAAPHLAMRFTTTDSFKVKLGSQDRFEAHWA